MSIESYKEKKSELDLFQKEISEIKKKEMEKKEKNEGKSYNPHFNEINPEELTDEDRIIYEKFKDGSMTLEDLEKYRKSVFSRIDEAAGITDEDRVIYKKFKNREITRDEFFDYCQKRTFREEKPNSIEKDSRANFCAWLTNQLLNSDWEKKKSEK